MAMGMIFQTLYVLVDLYFVAQLGDIAIAGVSAAGTVQFVVMALTQVLGVGTTVLIAVGVALELMRQIDSQLMLRNYEGFLK